MRCLDGPSLPITTAQTLANAVPYIEVDGTLSQLEAVTVLLKIGKN
jgi:hypothetical protein